MTLAWLLGFSLLGVAIGVVTGLLPGIHVNVTAAFLAAAAGSLAAVGMPPLAVAAFVVALTVTHGFLDIVPTVFLGVPGDESYALLPSQRLVMRGQGLEAVYHALHGSWGGLVLVCAVICVALAVGGGGLQAAEEALAPWLGWVLLAAAVVLVASDRRRGWALVVFTSSGLLGLMVFATPLIGRDGAFNVLFPSLAGLFGLSGMVLSLLSREAELPPQDDVVRPALDRVAVVSGTAGGIVSGLLPGLGSANVATLFALRGCESRYLQTVAAISGADHLMGIAALALIARSRSGAAAAVETVLKPTAWDMVGLCVVALAVGLACRYAMLATAPRLAAVVCGLPHRSLTCSVMVFVALLALLTTGPWGLVLLATSTALGMVAPLAGVRRAHAMGLFLVPVILRYNGWEASVVTFLHLGQINLPQSAGPLLPALAALLVALGAALSTYGWLQGRSRWKALALGAGFVAASVPLWVCTPGVAADAFEAHVVHVKDGDTIVVRRGDREVTLRLVDIDAPESKQARGTEAKHRVEALVLARDVRVRTISTDRYGRTLAYVDLDDGSVLNRRLVEEGWAWRFDAYCDDPGLLALQRAAQAAHRGLWADPDPIPPWKFRHPDR